MIGKKRVKCDIDLNPFKSSVAFHRETSHLICTANMKCNIELKWVK